MGKCFDIILWVTGFGCAYCVYPQSTSLYYTINNIIIYEYKIILYYDFEVVAAVNIIGIINWKTEFNDDII